MEEVARLVLEAEVAVLPLRGSSDAVGVLGRWLDGADAGRAEDALLASYHLYDKDLLALAPAIARALANDPSVLLCDEATSALDPKTTGGILDLLGRLNAQTGLTVVLITHEMGVVKQICSHVAVMEEGRIIERGSTVDVFTDPHEPLTRDFIDTANHVEAGITTVITHPDLVRHGSGDRLVSLQFAGATTGDPVVAALTRDYNVNATILFANVEVISGTPVGNLLLGLSGSQPDLDAAEGWLAGSGVRVHNYSDAEIESIRERAAAEAADVDGGRDEEDHR